MLTYFISPQSLQVVSKINKNLWKAIEQLSIVNSEFKAGVTRATKLLLIQRMLSRNSGGNYGGGGGVAGGRSPPPPIILVSFHFEKCNMRATRYTWPIRSSRSRMTSKITRIGALLPLESISGISRVVR